MSRIISISMTSRLGIVHDHLIIELFGLRRDPGLVYGSLKVPTLSAKLGLAAGIDRWEAP